jgi:RNA 2',3'-cyclic 3'-phosphodiesterase
MMFSAALMKTAEHSWRIFIAVELPSTLRQQISRHITELRRAEPEVRASWSRQENLHLTLKFLGETSVSGIPNLSEAMQAAVARVSPFEITIDGCGAFPSRGQPRVLWIGIQDPSRQLIRLQQALEDEGEKRGFDRERRDFHPHLTLARLRQTNGARRLVDLHEKIGFPATKVDVRELCLIRSEPGDQGSRYTVIERHELIHG